MTFLETIQRHGLTPERHRQLVLDQEGVCAVCGRYDSLVIDHDHRCCPGRTSCGECVRGLLCNGCNTALGLVKDDPETVARMLDYLVRQPERKPRPIPERIIRRSVEQDVMEALAGSPGPMGISALSRTTERSRAAVHAVVHRLRDTGALKLTAHGYELPEEVEA